MRLLNAITTTLVLAATLGVAQAKEWKTVRIGTEGAYPPFNYFDSNKELKGFDIDIAKAVCAAVKVECTFVAQSWDGIIPGLLAEKYDAIVASMSITEERKQKVDFTNKYYQTPANFVAPKSSEITDISPEALEGKILGAQSSTIHATYLEDVYRAAGATVKLYPTQDEANLDLASGRLDLILADKVVLHTWMQTEGGACCKFVGEEIRNTKFFGEGVGIAIRKGEEDLKALLNKGIEMIRADGTYEKINAEYFPFSVY